MPSKPRILVVDDEPVVRESLHDWFSADDYPVEMAANGPEAIRCLQASSYDILLTDVKMPGMDGLELQQKAREVDPDLTVIIMTAYASMDSALKAIKEGAYDYVTKPLDPEDLQQIINRAFEHRQLVRENLELRERVEAVGGVPDDIVGESPAMEAVRELIERVAPTEASVLISGEEGTGKELVAHAIHRASPRSQMPLVTVRCNDLSENRALGELFGFESDASGAAEPRRKGLLELANGATVLFDAVEALSPRIQTELQRVLKERAFSRVGGSKPVPSEFRVIAATRRDPSEGDALQPEFYRQVSDCTILLPPLRERASDVLPLAQYFLEKSARASGGPTRRISTAAMRRLMDYGWPGNVAELKNVIEQSARLQRDEISLEDLVFEGAGPPTGAAEFSLDAVEKQHIRGVLARVSGDLSKAARLLEIDEAALAERMRKYGLQAP